MSKPQHNKVCVFNATAKESICKGEKSSSFFAHSEGIWGTGFIAALTLEVCSVWW
jgi:hypothetical protein